jgi:hypothetical protein
VGFGDHTRDVVVVHGCLPHDLVGRRDVGQTLPEVALGDIGATTQMRVGGVA